MNSVNSPSTIEWRKRPLQHVSDMLDVLDCLVVESGRDVRCGIYAREPGGVGYWSPSVFHLFELRPARQAPPFSALGDRLSAQDHARLMQLTREAFETRTKLDVQYTVLGNNQNGRQFHSIARPLETSLASDGFIMIGLVTDRTRELAATAVLRAARRGERASELRLKEPLSRVPGVSVACTQRIGRLADEIRRHPMSVDEMARYVGLSRSRFVQSFKAVTGETPRQYLIHLRLQRAAELLAEPTAPKLAAVAAEAGFFDQAHFTRHFRKRYGITPGQMRERLMALTRPAPDEILDDCG